MQSNNNFHSAQFKKKNLFLKIKKNVLIALIQQ